MTKKSLQNIIYQNNYSNQFLRTIGEQPVRTEEKASKEWPIQKVLTNLEIITTNK